jgi:hypothetical protein
MSGPTYILVFVAERYARRADGELRAESRTACGRDSQRRTRLRRAARYHLIEAPEGSLDCGGQREWPLALVSTAHRTHATHHTTDGDRPTQHEWRAPPSRCASGGGGRQKPCTARGAFGRPRSKRHRPTARRRTLAHQRARGAGAVADVCAVASVGDVPAWRARGRACRCHRMLHPVPPPPLPTSVRMRYERRQPRVQSRGNEECTVQRPIAIQPWVVDAVLRGC